MEKLDIQSLFQSLQPELRQLDEERIKTKQAVRKVNLTWLPFVLAAVAVILWSLTQPNRSDAIFYLGGAFALGFYVVWALQKSKIVKEFAKSFKEKLIVKIVKRMDPDFAYNPESVVHLTKKGEPLVDHLAHTRLFPSFSECSTEDAIIGKVKGRMFEFSELKLETGGRNSKVVFQGVFIKVNLKTPIPSPIYILPDSANQLRDNLWKMLNLKSKRGEVVVLDHEPFEKLFKVYTEDPNITSSLLRRNILDRMVMMHEKISAINPMRDSISMAFIDNTVTIAVRLSTNLFEPRLREPINDLTYLERNVQYLVLFLGLIEDLNLSS